MTLTAQELENWRMHFHARTAQFASEGYDRLGAPEFILDQAGPIDGPALDVGTGMGLTARALARRGLEVVSVDTEAQDQEVAAFLTDDPAVAARIRFMRANARSLPFADGRFGCAVAIDVLHHLDEDGASVLREIARVVRPGGTIVLGDFSREGFEMVSRIHAAEGRVHPEGPVTMDRARAVLLGLGLTEVKTADGHMHEVSIFRVPGTRPPG